MKATVFDIQRSSFVDGPGIRTTVFFKGCNLRCAWCHNPESQSAALQMMFYKNKCTGCGKCKEKCPNSLEKCDFCGRCTLYCPHDAREICGKEYTVEEVLRVILKDKTFYENSDGGVTFSGGECMLQIDFLEEILKECKKNGIHTAVDTAGHVPFEKFERILPYTDLFLYDIKAFDEELHVKCTGASNRIILENLKYLDSIKKAIEVRIPLVPEYNSTEIEQIARFLAPLRSVKAVRVLPYHDYARSKYASLGMPDTLPEKIPTGTDAEAASEILARYGIIAK
jgi:pyruvate formate lyase activating enzyme